MRLLRSLARDRAGAASAEMVLVTPMLIILMFGAFEAGNFFWNEHIVVKAVRDAARYAGRQSFSAYSGCAVDSTVEGQIKNLARTGQISGGTARVNGWVNGDVTVSVACPGSGAATTGIYENQTGGAPVVTVSTVVDYTSLFGMLGFDTTDLKVAASAQSAVMGL